MRYLICDDVNEEGFYKLKQLKEKFSDLKVNCFVMGKDAGDYLKKDWIEVGVHGWSHSYPPECERENQRELIFKGLEALRPYLPEHYGFRAPGFQLVASTYPILKDYGFSFIAHQFRIQSLVSYEFIPGEILNRHIYDDNFGELNGAFNFLSEGLKI